MIEHDIDEYPHDLNEQSRQAIGISFPVYLKSCGNRREIGGKELRKFFFKLVCYLALSVTSFKLISILPLTSCCCPFSLLVTI